MMRAIDLAPGDEVIVPAFTWVASANAVSYCGATPVFVDVLPNTYNIDPEAAENALTVRTRAVLAVHLFGLCADMNELRARIPPEIPILEDAACAAGAEYRGKRAGGLGLMAAFSFHPRKIITTGEGGMITTGNELLATRVSRLRSHGAATPAEVRNESSEPFLLPDFDEVGYNYRMSDLQAALGIVQLSRLEKFVHERRLIADSYTRLLRDVPWLRTPEVPDGSLHSFQSYVVCLTDPAINREHVMRCLLDHGIDSRPGTHAVTELTVYRNSIGNHPGNCPTAAQLHHRSLALPMHNHLSQDDVSHVVATLRAI
jgi:dTDP-4-amino-4,6-dideoxygalactose transaminase